MMEKKEHDFFECLSIGNTKCKECETPECQRNIKIALMEGLRRSKFKKVSESDWCVTFAREDEENK